ncbi:MAG: HD-GYP domain-containing protein [Deltaproteobacteria bacterium]
MRRVYIEDLEPGMIIARSVMGADGRPLLTQNTPLTASYILRLRGYGIGSAYIKDGFSDIEIPEVVSAQVLNAVSSQLKQSMESFVAKRNLDMAAMKKSVALLIENILSNRQVLIQIDDIRSYSDYLLLHSINVAVFSIMTGLSMGYGESSLMDLGLGCLLHDIGLISIDPALLDRPDELTASERQQLNQHPEIGFNILRHYREISTTAAHIAYQHHERVDGLGYPRQLTKRQIVEYARIAAVADTFDEIISDHPYRRGYTVPEGLTVLRRLTRSHFDGDVVEAFALNIAIYPVGSLLKLNNGLTAVVTSVNRWNQYRPLVQVIADARGVLLESNYPLDLARVREAQIVRRLSESEAQEIKDNIAGRRSRTAVG